MSLRAKRSNLAAKEKQPDGPNRSAEYYCSAILRTRARAVPSASPITRNVVESNSMPVRRSPVTEASTSTPSTGFWNSLIEASIDLSAKYKDYKKERYQAAVQAIYDELKGQAP